MPTVTKKKKEPTKKEPTWKLNQNDYLDLLRSIEKNSQTILPLTNEVNRLKGRMGLGVGI